MPEARLDRSDGIPCKNPGLGTHTRNEIVSFGRRSLLCCVKRLTIFICESFDEVRPFAQKDARGSFIKGNSDEGGPAGMGAEAKSGLLHTTSPGLSENVA